VARGQRPQSEDLVGASVQRRRAVEHEALHQLLGRAGEHQVQRPGGAIDALLQQARQLARRFVPGATP